MGLFSLTTANGTVIQYRLLRSARKNIIVRTQRDGCLRINVPPFVSRLSLKQWLSDHEATLQRLWTQAQTHHIASQQNTLPAQLWFQGQMYPCQLTSAAPAFHFDKKNGFVFPAEQTEIATIKQQLRIWLQQQARDWLLPHLAQRAQQLHAHPAAMSLSNAKTLWGVCNPRTGVRLNWRLIGAPDWVMDYVCVHELCHLTHPDHSTAFWTLVAQYTPHTQTAKNWLKTHGSALFVLDE